MKKTFITSLVIVSFLIPTLTFAQAGEGLTPEQGGAPYGSYNGGKLSDINSVASRAVSLGNLFVSLMISLAVIWIMIHAFHYFIAKGPDDRKEGGMAILYGVIALFVIFSIWGFVCILKKSFQFSSTVRPSLNEIRIPDPITGM